MTEIAPSPDTDRALMRAEAALRAIATTANHDLNAPMRHIQVYVELLKSDHGHALSETGLDYVERIQLAAQRLSALVERLVDFARVISAPVQSDNLDLYGLAAAAAASVAADVDVGALPAAAGDPDQIKRVFVELVANAAEYAQGARIRVSGEVMDSGWVEVRVADAGPGIAAEYAEAIFEFLRRPPPADPQDARGTGLTICRHIIESHGGQIRLDAGGTTGSTFVFTLPPAAC